MPLAGIAAAFSLLSRLPIAGAHAPERALLWLWLPGMVIGMLAALAAWPWRHDLLAGALAAVVWAWATGGMHLEAVADFADGLGARHRDAEAYDRARKDARIGALGAVALVVVLLVKCAALTAWASAGKDWFALAWIGALARTSAMLWLAVFGARAGGMAALLARGASPEKVLMMAAWVWLAALFFAPLLALVAMAFALAWGAWVVRRLGGFDGDACGAGIEVSEAAMLVAVAAAQS